jgi:intraflagellar transport protein 74
LHTDDRTEKFRELVKKDKEMTHFIEKYEESRQKEIEKNTQLELEIITVLDKLSKAYLRQENIPTLEGFQNLKEDLQYKELQLSNAQTTIGRLQEGLAHKLALLSLLPVC